MHCINQEPANRSILQTQLNGFVRIWDIQKIKKSSISPDGVLEILFNAPSIVEFDKKG